MKKAELGKMTIDQLVERFIELGIAEYNASELGEAAKYNRFFREMRSIETELKSRQGDARSALMPLYDHPNPQVQLMAAEATAAVAPEAAQKTLEAIKLMRWHPMQAMEAGSFLRWMTSDEFNKT